MPATEPAPQEPTAESLGWQLRAALPPLRLHSVSLYDREAEVLWLSEGALGPDEHAFVIEALSALSADAPASQCERDFGDGRAAVFLAIRSPQAELVGLAMILVDAKALHGGGLAARLLAPPVRTLLQRLAILLRPATGAADGLPPAGREPDRASSRATSPAASPVASPAANPVTSPAASPVTRVAANPSPSATSSSRTLEILEWSPPEPVSTDTVPAVHAIPAVDPILAADAVPAADVMTATHAVIVGDAPLAPEAIDEILTFELAEHMPAATPAHGDRAPPRAPAPAAAAPAAPSPAAAPAPAPAAAPAPAQPPVSRDAACELYVQELVKLRPGGRTRRLQLMSKQPLSPAPRAEAEAGIGIRRGRTSRGDQLLERTLIEPLRQLAAWLDAHAALVDDAALHFSIEVAPAALEIDDLPERLAECIGSLRLAPASLAFEIAESACLRERERAERLIHTLEQLGCGLILDDFVFDSAALELLRSKALRLVKLDRTLIRAALRDKLAQARIVAISQAARVLGIHCAAKHVEALATQRWLAAAGVDLAEGPLFGGPRPLAALVGERALR